MLPRAPAEPAVRRSADALPRLRLTGPATTPGLRVRALASVASGLALAVAFPPADFGPLAFVALTPLVWAWRGATPRRAALYGFLAGVAFFAVLLEWSRYFGAVAIVPLVVGEAAFLAAAGALVAALERRGFRSPWIIAAVWVVFEGLRARVPFGGMPWGEVGVAMHDVAPVRALASIGGVALVSFVVVAGNALIVDALVGWREHRRRSLQLASVGLAVLAAVVLSASALRYEPRETGQVRFALLQALDENRDLTQAEINRDYLMRRHLGLASRLRGPYDLIVFPESALERDPTRFSDVRDALVAIGAEHGAVVLANARILGDDGGVSNSTLAYTPTGRLEGTYAKQRLVPFGEYVPMRDLLSFIGELDRVPYDYERGSERVLFRAAGRDFATVICFESAFGSLVRDFVRDGAELVVVSTNNRSYRRSGLAAQHIAMSQMRAAETARPVLHASISGITGVIDVDGDVHETSELFEQTITSGAVSTTTGQTLYVRFGDWVLLLSAAALVVTAAISAWRSRRTPAVDSRS